MGKRIWATCVAIFALAVAGATATAAPNPKDDPPEAGHTPEQLALMLKLIGPQDPAIVEGLTAGCRELTAEGLGSAPCERLLQREARESRVRRATFTCSTNPCNGTSGSDVITGTSTSEGISAMGGDDDVDAKSGADLIAGGTGDDLGYGSLGNDWLVGEDGADELYGGDSGDLTYINGVFLGIHGSADRDDLDGEDGDDYLTGDQGQDEIRGGQGNDLLTGEGDNGDRDHLYGGAGIDVCDGGANDVVDATCEAS